MIRAGFGFVLIGIGAILMLLGMVLIEPTVERVR